MGTSIAQRKTVAPGAAYCTCEPDHLRGLSSSFIKRHLLIVMQYFSKRRVTMAERWQNEPWAKDMWWSGKTTRRRFLGFGAATAGALGATLLVPAPWREAFGQSTPYKIGTLQPLSGTAAAGGKTALIGTQMAVDRINKSRGINGRMIELVI